MGTCVSVWKDKGAVDGQSLPGCRSPSSSSKNEDFFDSQAWLESDCDDDFFSVNGDFTPSHGSTNYQIGLPVRSELNKSSIFYGSPDTRLEPSPRKKLAELLQETLSAKPPDNEHGIVDREVEMNGNCPPKALDGTPYLSGMSSIYIGERTPNADFIRIKGKRGKMVRCCLPSLVHSLGSNECKKHSASPSHQTDG